MLGGTKVVSVITMACLGALCGCSESEPSPSQPLADASIADSSAGDGAQVDSSALAEAEAAALSHNILLIAREHSADMAFMIENEVNPIIAALTEAKYQVTVATYSGDDLSGDGGVTLKVDSDLASIDVSGFIGIVIPCMAAGGSVNSVPLKAKELVQQANSALTPIAAQQSGVIILGEAGVLQGKNYAIAEANQVAAWGGTWQGTGVVVDGNIVSSGTCPYVAAEDKTDAGTLEMVTKFIELLPR